MKVRVKNVGEGFFAFWGGRVRNPGDIIELGEDEPLSDVWMEVVDDDDEKPKRTRTVKAKGEGAE